MTIHSNNYRLGQPADDVTAASASFVAAATALITLAFMCPLSRSWAMSVDESWAHVFVEYAQPEVGSDAWTQSAAFVAIGLFGLAAIVCPGGRLLRAFCSIAIVWTAYFAFSAMSCALHGDPVASLKRYAGDLCGLLLALGLARRLSLRQFVWIVFVSSLTWLCLGLLAELTQGSFRPWASGYRFAGLFHPNGTGDACALVLIAASHLLRRQEKYHIGLWLAAALGFALLILTRSRTAAVVCLLVLSTPWLIRAARRHTVLAIVGGVFAVAAGVIVSATDLMEAANSTVFSREEKDVSLAGRDIIWKELLPYIAERPFLGHGYGFWSTDRSFTMPAQSAHSLYVDSVVHFGIFGTLLYLWGMTLSMRRAILSAQKWPEADYAFIALLMLYLLVRGLTESEVGFTHNTNVLVLCGIGFLIFREGFDACGMPQPAPSHRRKGRSSQYRPVNGRLTTGET